MFIIIQYYGTGLRLWAAVLSGTRAGGPSLPLIAVLSDRFREKIGNLLGNGQPKTEDFPGISCVLGRFVWVKIPGISWVLVISDFPGNFREFVGVSSVGEFWVKIPKISEVLVRRGILVQIAGNCEVFVFPGISNYISGSLWGFIARAGRL